MKKCSQHLSWSLAFVVSGVGSRQKGGSRGCVPVRCGAPRFMWIFRSKENYMYSKHWFVLALVVQLVASIFLTSCPTSGERLFRGYTKFDLRPFLTRIFFQELFRLEGSKICWEKKNVFRKFTRQKFAQEKKVRILPAEEMFGSKISWRQDNFFGSLYNRTEISTR